MHSDAQFVSPHPDSPLKFFDVPHLSVHIEMSATLVTQSVMHAQAGSAWHFMICAQQFALLHMAQALSSGDPSQTGAPVVPEDVGASLLDPLAASVVPAPVLAAPVESPGPLSSPHPASATTMKKVTREIATLEGRMSRVYRTPAPAACPAGD